MIPAHILEQKLRAAEETIECLTLKLEHTQGQLRLATIRMQQSEDTMRGLVEMWSASEPTGLNLPISSSTSCECIVCSKRRSME